MDICKFLVSRHSRLVGPKRSIIAKLANRRKKRRVQNLLIDKKHNVIMDWTPKSGCTIVTKMFFQSMGLLDEAVSLDHWVHRYRQEVFYKNHVMSLEDLVDQSIFLFKVVRNPYTRAVSSYLHICKNGHNNPKMQAKGKRNFVDYASVTFADFVEELARINIKFDCNSHCRVQVKNYERAGLRQPFVCKLETLWDDMKVVNARCSTQFNIENITSHHHVKKDEGGEKFCGRTAWKNFADVSPDYKFFYDKAIFDEVTRLYQDDIKHYNYEFPWPELLD
jgi:hypothetical protein